MSKALELFKRKLNSSRKSEPVVFVGQFLRRVGQPRDLYMIDYIGNDICRIINTRTGNMVGRQVRVESIYRITRKELREMLPDLSEWEI